ncbi:Outer membrane protein OmpA [Spirosomataceae bacterium TFI 002]|nr:Outer membrane protein OmpA [Spirosomataceae bacterium TFI 002]
MKKLIIYFSIFSLGVATMTSCNSLRKLTKEQKGAIIGIGAGGAAGAAIGAKSKNPAVYAIIGSTVGGVAGAVIGKYMDKQAAELQKELGKVAEVERVEEGIKLTMDSGILFGFDSYQLSAKSKAELQKLANVLEKYEDTDILVAGHTDNVGSEAYNEKLSKQRAQSVSDLLSSYGVKSNRMVIRGYGENAPVVSNETESGQQKNRRVELAIVANNDLKKSAQKENTISQNLNK